MLMGNFVEKERKLKKLKHVSALACIFGRRVESDIIKFCFFSVLVLCTQV
jgi:hypothetical protein